MLADTTVSMSKSSSSIDPAAAALMFYSKASTMLKISDYDRVFYYSLIIVDDSK